jgi:hypothetical protein
MPTKQQSKPPADQPQQDPQVHEGVIANHVMHILGQPGDLHRVQVRLLWEGHYRVNVLVGGDPTSVKVAHSFFLVADDNGRIRESSPEITRQYEPGSGGKVDPCSALTATPLRCEPGV